MTSQAATYEALWRSSAKEGVAYSEDFPEVLLTHPELYDGSINQGKATHIWTTYDILPNGKIRCTTRDNGQGIFLGLGRFCTWAAPKSASIHHRYGHGTKKYLTKAQPEYITSDWVLQWRNKMDPGHLYTVRGPYRGVELDYLKTDDTTDTTTLVGGGTQFIVDIDAALFHQFVTADSLFAAEKEIICSRHPQQLDDGSVQFTLIVKHGDVVKTENSVTDGWTSLRTFLDNGDDTVRVKVFDEVHPIAGGTMRFSMYHVYDEFKKALVAAFPLYGRRSTQSSRIHISLGGRMIEARAIYKFMNKKSNHNDLNGYIGFVDFVPSAPTTTFEELPEPTTTKVMFSDECPAFEVAKQIIVESMERNKPMASGGVAAWKNLVHPSIIRIIEQKRQEEASAPLDVEPTTNDLGTFGITITIYGRGVLQITHNGHEPTLVSGTAADRDYMIRHASAKKTANEAYAFLMNLVNLLHN